MTCDWHAGGRRANLANSNHLADGACHFADKAWFGTTQVARNSQVAESTFRIAIHAPQIAERINPGQFVMLRPHGVTEPLLGRPLALYDTIHDGNGRPVGIELIYLVLGRGTAALSKLAPGDQVDIWGPLGNSFPHSGARHLFLVAGGIGQTPFLAVAKERLGIKTYGREIPKGPFRKITFCYGVRSAPYFPCLEDFESLRCAESPGCAMHLSTDDGSRGHHGRVTELLEPLLLRDSEDCEIFCCGPEPMMHAASQVAADRRIPCRISLETPMACGIGICFSCVAKIRQQDGGWDYRRTCVEGPIFDAAIVEF